MLLFTNDFTLKICYVSFVAMAHPCRPRPLCQSLCLALVITRLRDQGSTLLPQERCHTPATGELQNPHGAMLQRGRTQRPVPADFDLHGWEDALRIVAHLVVKDPVYAPLFSRIEAEISRLQNEDDIVSRARKITTRSGRR